MALVETIGSSALDGLLAQPGGYETVRAYAKKLREGFWDSSYVDAIGTSRGSLPMEEVAVFAQLHGMIFGGLVGMALISAEATPKPDRERQANADALSALPHPFAATVDQAQVNEPGDGTLSWDEPISIAVVTGIPAGEESLYTVHYEIPPGRAPLEIGSTPPSRTWLHLVGEDGVLARWPYGQECIRLFVNFDFIPRKRGRRFLSLPASARPADH